MIKSVYSCNVFARSHSGGGLTTSFSGETLEDLRTEVKQFVAKIKRQKYYKKIQFEPVTVTVTDSLEGVFEEIKL